ncbi:dihydrolipoamide acetyltransferase family protein [Isosphaeraceae bacterium EP7]
MPTAITVPRLGWNMEEGVFAGWLKRDGDPVREGEPLFSLEGDKSTQDVESIDPGTLNIPPDAPAVGDKVLVGAILGYLLTPGEAAPAASPASRPVRTVEAFKSAEPEVLVVVRANGRGRVRSTPLARRIARELGIDWVRLAGSGSGGRIRKVDVLEAARDLSSRAEVAPVPSVAVSPIRRTIAARMVESRRTTAPVTLMTTIDATNLVSLRLQFRDARSPKAPVPSFTDFFIKLTALALADHPMLNARWADDRIELSNEAHVGFAVDTEAGLLVPVVRGAGELGLRQIAERSLALIGQAREGHLPAADMRGGTFTITNLGAFGIEAFTPIINSPECAILGLGRIARQPVTIGEQIVSRERMTLSLTFDHRIVDGGPAARFLQDLSLMVENPGPWLIA